MPTDDAKRAQRLLGAAFAAFVAFELASEARHLMRQGRQAGSEWWRSVERRDDRRRNEAAFVLLLSRLPGARSRGTNPKG